MLRLLLALVAGTTILAAFSAPKRTNVSSAPVIIVGAGMAGTKLAYDLHNANIPFVIVEATDRVGGRMRQGHLYKNGPKLELGANWLQGYRADDRFSYLVRHVLRLSMIPDDLKDYHFYANGTRLSESVVDPVRLRMDSASDKIYRFRRAYATGLNGTTRQDISVEDALLMAASWHARSPMEKAVQQAEIDYEYARRASLVSIHELSEYYDPDEPKTKQFYITEERGYRQVAVWHLQQAGISEPDRSSAQLRLNSPVSEIRHGPLGARVTLRNGRRISGSAVVLTASLGVLRGSLEKDRFLPGRQLRFFPPLSIQKRIAISKMSMGTYVKIFVKFHTSVLKSNDPLYIRPLSCRENYFTSLQNLNKQGYRPGENIVLYTAVGSLGREVECVSHQHRLREALNAISKAVGRMVGLWEVHSVLVSPFLENEFFQGMYSGRPVGVTDEDLNNFRRPEGSLFFAGEAYHENQGYVQSAYYSAEKTGKEIINYLQNS